METRVRSKRDSQKAADIIGDAGGEVVGRTRLQKLAYLLELAGVGEGFQFQYKHYGPFSEELASATRDATLLGLINEEERPATWGGYFSIYSVRLPKSEPLQGSARCQLAKIAVEADPIELELAATAAFLRHVEKVDDPWAETARRKPEKITAGRLERAKTLYQTLRQVKTPIALPDLAQRRNSWTALPASNNLPAHAQRGTIAPVESLTLEQKQVCLDTVNTDRLGAIANKLDAKASDRRVRNSLLAALENTPFEDVIGALHQFGDGAIKLYKYVTNRVSIHR